MTVNVGENLREQYQSNKSVRAICDVFKTYTYGIHQIMTHSMEAHLLALGTPLIRSDVIAGFRSLEEVGIGKYVEGRHGWKSRFEFIDKVTTVIKLLDGENLSGLELETFEQSSLDSDESCSHVFMLRPDFSVEIRLPADLTEREALRLSKFVECLPLEGDSTL